MTLYIITELEELITEINKRDFYAKFNFKLLDTNEILNKIVMNINDVIKYIKKIDEENKNLKLKVKELEEKLNQNNNLNTKKQKLK